MKNSITCTIEKNRDEIKSEWGENLLKACSNKLTADQSDAIVSSAVDLFLIITSELDYSAVDQYLIEACSYFSSIGFTLLDSSQFFY
jgi:hypothetical protein